MFVMNIRKELNKSPLMCGELVTRERVADKYL